MKKILPLMVIGILVLSGLGAGALIETETVKNRLIEKTNFYQYIKELYNEYNGCRII